MGLVDRVSETRLAVRSSDSQRFNLDQWISDYLVPAGQFNYNGQNYPLGLNQTANGWQRTREVTNTLPAYANALRRCPPAYAAEMVRAFALSGVRFTFRTRIFNSVPRKLFGTSALSVLDHPWPNATCSELVSRMEWHAGTAGNSFVTNWEPDRLRVLRPDWVAIVYGSALEPEDPGYALDGEIVGYIYQNGGFAGENRNPIRTLRVSEVAHWSPLPDPLSPGLGMSWITPALRDMQGDGAATEHKLRFFENGATPNLVIKGLPAVTEQKFNALVDMLEANHSGVRNAYRTYYLTAGADATVVGADMRQMDFAATQGKGETRIAMLARVPAAILQISEGLQGSSLNAGNFIASRRVFADLWVYPTLQDLAGSLAPLVNVPPDAELWFDTADMPILREDAKDAADIEQVKATTIGGLVKDGFTPESAVAAVMGQNMNLLKPIPGWISVQMQPQTGAPSPDNNGSTNGAAQPPQIPAAGG